MSIPFRNDRLLNPSRSTISIDKWYGLNYTDTVANGECTEMKNITNDGTYLMPRPPREVIASGITNPQRVLFCGDRLSYIAGGKLYLNKVTDEGFGAVGEVGTVTAAVDYNNTKMLFYPSDYVYDYKKQVVEKTVVPFIKSDGGNKVEVVKGNKWYQIEADCIELRTDENRPEIVLSPLLTKENAEDETRYPIITVNCTDDTPYAKSDFPDVTYKRSLFVKAWDADGNLLTVEPWSYQDDTEYYKEFAFGEPISFENGYAAKLNILVGYYRNYKPGQSIGNTDNITSNAKTEELDNANFLFWQPSAFYPSPQSRPNIAYACMDNNRVVAVQGNNFYASCLGDYTNWTDFTDAEGNPKETGAYAEELYTYGDFTGIIKYRNNVIITKKNMLYECYGNKPPYRINLAANVGCVDSRSMAEVSGVLYWLGAKGVYRYSGGLPVNISHKINPAFGKFNKGCAATDGRRYYVYANGEKQSCLLVYDTFTGLWYREDDIEIADLTSFDNWVYALTTDGTLYKFNSGNETVEWEYQTKDFDLGTSLKKIPKKVVLKTQATLNAKLDIYIKYDNGDYERIASYSSFEKSVVDIRLKNKVCDSFSLKLCGRGNITVQGISIEVIGSGKKHNKDYLVRY